MRRLTGGRIDRQRGLRFTFDGKTYTGQAGDTLASALLANGVHLMGRSFKYHRPRGVLSHGSAEPNALVQLEQGGGLSDPNQRATVVELFEGLNATSQNRWPSLRRDVGAINDLLMPFFPAGFYYKTFMWPRAFWDRVYEPIIRQAAGLGRAPSRPDPEHYAHRHVHADVLVVGAGPAGLMAALAAGRSGARVILCDEQNELGGSLLDRGTLPAWAEAALAELTALPEVRLLPRTTCAAYDDHEHLLLVERVQDHLAPRERDPDQPRQRLWQVRAKRVILATGAIERPIVLHQNDRPGIMLGSAALAFAQRWAVKPGHRVLVVTNGSDGYRQALALNALDIEVPAIVDLRHAPAGFGPGEAEAAGIPVLAGHSVTGTAGRLRVEAARVAPIAQGIDAIWSRPRTIACDAIAMAGGWNPSVHLWCQGRGKLRFDEAIQAFVPSEGPAAATVVGAANGTFDLAAAMAEGAAAGGGGGELPELVPTTTSVGPIKVAPTDARRMVAFVDLQNDVQAKDVRLAVKEGFRSVEHVKRYTTTGMATDQGKTSNVNALAVVAAAEGTTVPAVGTTTFRSPYTPVTFGAIVGANRRELFDPVRTTPMHPWHVENGALFEDVGQWKRAWYYPERGETKFDAVRREALAVREAAGLFDASTLGKIDVRGPDARTFLNRVYTNAWSKLAPGRVRYGLMLNDAGFVIDDGTTACLADNHFHMTTTTGGAARVLAWLEEWLQTEWPELRVHLTSVTEQWAVAALSGPKARDILAQLTDADLGAQAFPHMSWQAATVAGLPARIFRVSFTGEVGFEINVPSDGGLHLWQELVRVGRPLGLSVYGTETMHLLRAEKGFVVVGQDTDGTVTPFDLGMEWIVARSKGDFIGKRGLERPDLKAANRRQLVGLVVDDPSVVLEEGAQVVAAGTDYRRTPVKIIGWVTSSYPSPTLGRGIAFALIEGGFARMGQPVWIPGPVSHVEATITTTQFYDPEGLRLRC
ncbi:MAG: sarcosine oxidase subunit alpha family protein [Geminicoccaceae bacterium]|nr:MAG: sarcosine oxidase subunit alpha family protein [Geminicoccaceae bacterium]